MIRNNIHQVQSPSSIMNLDRLAERLRRRPFRRPSWISPLTANLFVLKTISMDSLTRKTYLLPPNSSLPDRPRWRYMGYKAAAAILDAILNSTFLPHIWNVYPSFFKSPMGPLQRPTVKIRGHMIAHRTPLSPRTKSQELQDLLVLLSSVT